MSSSDSKAMPWSRWHERLHKHLLTNPELLPKGASLLLSVSGGQDSMVLVHLLTDLQRLHQWDIHAWHGNHNWHDDSKKIASDLDHWFSQKKLKLYCDDATKNQTYNEASSREWRYECLTQTASIISCLQTNQPCNYVVTGHTATDQAETLLMNLARGSDLDGLCSLKACRNLKGKLKLIRPMLQFSREDTAQICKDFKLPIWEDPSNTDYKLTRNRIRKYVLPVLEDLHTGSTIRIASLAERINHYKENQDTLTRIAIRTLGSKTELNREKLAELPIPSRGNIIAFWLKEAGAKNISTAMINEISYKTSKGRPAGEKNLPKGWKITWKKNLIQIKKIS